MGTLDTALNEKIHNAVAQKDIRFIADLLRRQFSIGLTDDDHGGYIQWWGSQSKLVCMAISANIVEENDEYLYRSLAAGFANELNFAQLPAPDGHTLHSYARVKNAQNILTAIEKPPTLALVFVGKANTGNANSSLTPPKMLDLRSMLMDGAPVLESLEASVQDSRLPQDLLRKNLLMTFGYALETLDLGAAEQVASFAARDQRFSLAILSELKEIAIRTEQLEIAAKLRDHAKQRVAAAEAKSGWDPYL